MIYCWGQVRSGGDRHPSGTSVILHGNPPHDHGRAAQLLELVWKEPNGLKHEGGSHNESGTADRLQRSAPTRSRHHKILNLDLLDK
jgi:hypothetical protein